MTQQVLSQINLDYAAGSTVTYNTTRFFEEWSIFNPSSAFHDAHVPRELPSSQPFRELLRWPFRKREFQTQLLHYFSKSDNKSNHHHPSPSCLILIFGRLSFADHPRAFFSSGDFSTDLFWTTSIRVDLWETLITSFTFSLPVYFC